MASKKSRGLNRRSKKTFSTRRKLYVLNDNLTNALSAGASSSTYMKHENLDLPKNVTDTILLRKFNAVVTAASATGVVLTSDRGKKNPEMPREIAKYSRLTPIYITVRGSQSPNTAYVKLRKQKGFRDPASIARNEWIRLSEMSDRYRVEYRTKKGAVKTKDIPKKPRHEQR